MISLWTVLLKKKGGDYWQQWLVNIFKTIYDPNTILFKISSNREGIPTSDPNEALPSGGGCGLPLGGQEETSGYKVSIYYWLDL